LVFPTVLFLIFAQLRSGDHEKLHLSFFFPSGTAKNFPLAFRCGLCVCAIEDILATPAGLRLLSFFFLSGSFFRLLSLCLFFVSYSRPKLIPLPSLLPQARRTSVAALFSPILFGLSASPTAPGRAKGSRNFSPPPLWPTF